MFKKTLSAVLALVMTVASFAMLAIPTSAADTTTPTATTTLENLYEFDSYATPNQTSATDNPKKNFNYALSKLITVSAGDKIYVAPTITEQDYYITAYKADGSVHTKAVKSEASLTNMTSIANNTSIMCYTVPADVASIRVVASQLFADCVLITKNVAFTADDYINYCDAHNINVRGLVGIGSYSADPDDFVDVTATGGIYAGRADKKTGSSISNDNLVSSGSYFCTKGYIEVKPDDMVYFIGKKSQSYHLIAYAENKDGITDVTKKFMVQYDDLGDYAIYAYRIRQDVKYIRYTYAAALHNAGFPLFTINQPFTQKTLRMWADSKGVSLESVESILGKKNLFEFDSYAKPSKTDATTAGDTDLNFALSKLISVKEGDKIYMGPVLLTQSYHMSTYKSDNSLHTEKIKTANVVEIDKIKGNVGIICYTVPKNVTSIRVVGSQMFDKYIAVTKNMEFTFDDYLAYLEKEKIEIKTLFEDKSVDAYDIDDVSETGGKYFGRADIKAANVTTTNNLLTDSKGRYYCTEGYVEVKEGDVVYFLCENTQGYHLTLYDENKNGTTTVTTDYVIHHEDLENNYSIYSYKVRGGTKYARYTFATALNNAGIQLMTVNQPFDASTLTRWALNIKGADQTTVENLIGVYYTPPTNDAGLVLVALLGTISLAGVVVLAKKLKNN